MLDLPGRLGRGESKGLEENEERILLRRSTKSFPGAATNVSRRGGRMGESGATPLRLRHDRPSVRLLRAFLRRIRALAALAGFQWPIARRARPGG